MLTKWETPEERARAERDNGWHLIGALIIIAAVAWCIYQ